MDNKLHILMADYVPLANKGEEAIVRGIEDMLSEGAPVALGLFDNVPRVTQRENLTVFPRNWLFRCEGNTVLSPRGRILRQALLAAQLRCGIYGPLRNLTSGSARYRPLADFFDRAQYVLVGHDGVFGLEACGIVHLAQRHGKRAGILGASTGLGGGRWYKAWLYRRTMAESDFFIVREQHSLESLLQVCPDPAKLRVGPDPAFALRPAPAEAAREVLERYESYRRARQDGRPVIAVTALEKGRVYASFRPDLHGRAKQEAHARYLATILDDLVAKSRAFVLFLPHAVEQDASDLAAARHVCGQMKAMRADAAVLEQDCGPRLLKSLIRECDFLVGERTHALIGAVSVGTPFAALTNRQDTRTHGILGQMCRCAERIVDMDVTGADEAARKVSQGFETRAAQRPVLENVRQELARQIGEMVHTIKGSHRSAAQT
ncbi:MAG: polysaccharide pyruvyl transferase family protein [Planctomycetes bacterium]|nr:polysaccharide pyruvyl transferase family protein [Planctomycetota bacterium]